MSASPEQINVDTIGQHLLVELHDCDRRLLNDAEALQALMRAGAEAAGARVVAEVFHPYAPQGITGVVVIEESHFSLHTWPEFGYAALDFYTCGECLPERAVAVVSQGLGARRTEVLTVKRGLRAAQPSLRVEPELSAAQPTAGAPRPRAREPGS